MNSDYKKGMSPNMMKEKRVWRTIVMDDDADGRGQRSKAAVDKRMEPVRRAMA